MRPAPLVVCGVLGFLCVGGVVDAAGDDGVAAVRHTVRRGQTLYSIARTYGVPLERIAAANGIQDPSRVRAGARLLIPGARKPARRHAPPGRLEAPATRRVWLTAPLPWPIEGPVISGFARPRRGHTHRGIDIKSAEGTPIRAVADGTVILAEERYGNYGRLVAIEHENGMVSWYGHNQKNLVHAGERVRAEEVIARVGHSGNASTDHLHFEVHVNGNAIDPLTALTGPGRAEVASGR